MMARPTGAGRGPAARPAPAARRFHGWRIVATLAVTETVSWGVLYYAFSVLLLPMQADLGLSTAALTGVFSWSVLLTGLAAVPVGRWLDAHGARSLMTAGSVLAALLVVAWSQVNGLTALFAVFTGIGLVRAAVLYEAAFAVVVRWFHTKRSTALLTVTVVAGFASTIFLPTTQALTDAFGWRGALLVLAGLLAVVTVLPHWLVLRRDPRDVDQWPDGEPPPTTRTAQDALDSPTPSIPSPSGPAPSPPRLRDTARVALGDPVYRWLAAGFAANALAVIVVAVHLVPYLREQGHSASFAAVAAGSLGALSVSGRLVVTGAARRWPPVLIAATAFGLQGAAVVLLLLRGDSTAGAVGFVVLFGLGFGVATITRPAVLAQTYGTEQYATLSGLMAVVLTLATTLGPVAAGVLRTTTGDYTAVLIGLVLTCVVSAGALLRASAVTHVTPTSGFTQSSFDPSPPSLVTSTRAGDNNSD